MKILTIIGARPQFIKAAIVNHALKQSPTINEILVHTGQHFDENMSNIFFSELDIEKPKYNLGIGGGLHGAMTGAQLAAIEDILIKEKPDWLLVYGDTNSTLAGALAASKLHIPVAHIEAGLRSFNRKMPEEINRVITDHISELLFAPTSIAIQHLQKEGIRQNKCHLIGDVMLDAALFYGEKAKKTSKILSTLKIKHRDYVLATVHRAENTDDLQRLKNILSALKKVSETLPVICPLHPRTRQLIEQHGLKKMLGENVRLIEPVGYLDMVMLEQNAVVIATDSGGVQKEAFFYHVPCVTLRDETEWVELVEAGWNKLTPPLNSDDIAQAILSAIGTQGSPITPYGDGRATQHLKDILLNY